MSMSIKLTQSFDDKDCYFTKSHNNMLLEKNKYYLNTKPTSFEFIAFQKMLSKVKR